MELHDANIWTSGPTLAFSLHFTALLVDNRVEGDSCDRMNYFHRSLTFLTASLSSQRSIFSFHNGCLGTASQRTRGRGVDGSPRCGIVGGLLARSCLRSLFHGMEVIQAHLTF